MHNHVAWAGMLKKMFNLMGVSKTKEPKDFLAGCPQVLKEISWKVESF